MPAIRTGALAVHSLPSECTVVRGVYLTRVTTGQVQHVEEEAELTGQAELLLAEVVLHQAADGLQEVQHLARPRAEPSANTALVLPVKTNHQEEGTMFHNRKSLPVSCSYSMHWECAAPGLQTGFCCSA